MNRPRSRRVTVLLASASAAVFALAGCASSGGKAASPGGGGSAPVSSKTPTGSPITIGYLVPDSGVEANPQVLPAEEKGLAYVNGTLGGINGHPLQIEVCHSDGTPSKAVACANDFVGKKVVAVIDGFDRGAGSGLPVYKSAGIPVIGNVAQGPVADTTTDGSYYALGPANAVYAVGPLQSFAEQGLKKIVFALDDIPAQHTYADKFLLPVAKKLGMNFSAIYYDATSPNFSIVGSTVKSSNPDLAGAVTLTNPAQCAQFIQSARQAGFTNKILAGNCVGFQKTVGAQAAGVEIYSNVWYPEEKQYAPPVVQKQLDITEQALSGVPSSQLGFYTYEMFATLMDFTNVVKTISGTVTAAAIKDAFSRLRNFQSWTGPTISCGANFWPGSSACSNKLLLSIAQSDGSLKPAGGGFITATPSLVPSS